MTDEEQGVPEQHDEQPKKRAPKLTPLERVAKSYAMKFKPDDLAERVVRELHAMGVEDVDALRAKRPRDLALILVAAVQADAFTLLACAETEAED